jgi:hypothetical protein
VRSSYLTRDGSEVIRVLDEFVQRVKRAGLLKSLARAVKLPCHPLRIPVHPTQRSPPPAPDSTHHEMHLGGLGSCPKRATKSFSS